MSVSVVKQMRTDAARFEHFARGATFFATAVCDEIAADDTGLGLRVASLCVIDADRLHLSPHYLNAVGSGCINPDPTILLDRSERLASFNPSW